MNLTRPVEASARATTLEVARRSHDAIVIGAGAAGALAAFMLTRAGLSTLVLDAGFSPPVLKAPFRRAFHAAVGFSANPRLASVLPRKVVGAGRRGLRLFGRLRQPVQTQCYAWERAPDIFVDDVDNPYTTAPGTSFNWIRARGLGGRMVVPGHGRQYYRFARRDFRPTDGQSPEWPFEPAELDPWYESVETLLDLHGRSEHLSSIPNSVISTETTPTPAEQQILSLVQDRWPNCQSALSRYAPPADLLTEAASHGSLRIRRGAIAAEILVGRDRVRGVRWIDQERGREVSTEAPLVFLAASALESTRLLLLSKTGAGERIGARSSVLGCNLMDHVMVKAEGIGRIPKDEPAPESGRCVYLPRFDERDGKPSNTRGFGVQIYQSPGLGSSSYFTAVAFSEMLPDVRNRVQLDPVRRDRWGIPVLKIECRLSSKELERAGLQAEALGELGDLTGAKLTRFDPKPFVPGTAVHECGTARMGTSPDASVLDPFNECWDAKGLFVTDGASFPSQAIQNPTLTIMALTARACAHAVTQYGRR